MHFLFLSFCLYGTYFLLISAFLVFNVLILIARHNDNIQRCSIYRWISDRLDRVDPRDTWTSAVGEKTSSA